MATTVAAQAQTYYYYPTSVTPAPAVTSGSTGTPTYYYRRGLFGRRVWTSYSPQSYQTAYTPQNYQPANSPQVAQQTEASQVPTSAQVIRTSYSSNAITGTAGAATQATAQPAVTEATAEPAAMEATAEPAATGDPYGFIGWLNSTRAAYGLPAVGYDPNLSSWAAENNNHQATRGMGHFVMGPARRQNAAFGSITNIGSMWMNSPAHRAALLDPTIRWIGIAGLGAYWTFNAN